MRLRLTAVTAKLCLGGICKLLLQKKSAMETGSFFDLVILFIFGSNYR
jgi:hypothetical protein